jgi:hypothetical protein
MSTTTYVQDPEMQNAWPSHLRTRSRPGLSRLIVGQKTLTGLEIKYFGTDQRNGVSFDQKEGSAVAGWIRGDEFGAHAHVARHARNCAEWLRTQDVAHRSLARTGWPGVRAS